MNMNNTTNPVLTASEDFREKYEIIVFAIVLSIIMLVALLGNLLVILAIYKHDSLRQNISSLFLMNLSVTDLTMAIMVMPTALVCIIMDLRNINYSWCIVTSTFNYVLQIDTMLTLCFISIERYIAIIYPFRHITLVTKTRVVLTLVYSWLQALAFVAPTVTQNWIHYDYLEAVCAINWTEKQAEVFPAYIISAFLGCYLLPCSIMVFCYSRIIQKVRSRPSNLQATGQHSKNKKIIFSLITVVIVYLVCYVPLVFTRSARSAGGLPIHVPGNVNLASAFLGYSLSAVNPFIYGIFRPEFRKAYKRILKCMYKN